MESPSSNPYASPLADSETARRAKPLPTQAEREVRVIIRIFRYIGWPLSILFVPMGALLAVAVPIELAMHHDDPWKMLMPAVLESGIAVVSIQYLRVASKMARREPKGRRAGQLLSALMMILVPIFTVIGIFCLYKLTKYYAAYCADERLAEASGDEYEAATAPCMDAVQLDSE